MSSIILLFLCLFIGLVIKRLPNFPNNTHVVLNQFVLFISVPAMALYHLPEIELNWELLFPTSVAYIGFLFAAILFIPLGKYFGWSNKLIGCLLLTAGLGNTSFVGIPVIQALYGDEGIKTLIIVDIPGTVVVLSSLGMLTAMSYSKGEKSIQSILINLIKFPPFIAFLVGLGMLLLNLHFTSYTKEVLGKLMATVSPLALVSVGFQLKIERRSKHWKFLALGLFYCLIIWPMICFLIYCLGFKQNDLPIKVSIMEAAMPPMITGAIVAVQYGLKPRLANMMIGVGIPLSFITMAIWYMFLEWYLG
ncbi:AEC family transporter [Faecalibacter bovis]|uniref:AEC family transporter n=1 Tax=Faecalibacter bovis TaxID=2898187 RepID=A0ABX7XFP1_9FLAO|nr:AEC family transporter [Faecalibacter bovis]MBS7333539.1 AEC family transporter [Weeksellaceae bacterium]QTV06720.1 AEC family transporter [Faecalibacter bovis]